MAEVSELTVEKPKKASKAKPEASKAPKKASKEASNAFAVISTGGKQYLVKPGQKLKIEKVLGDHKEGDVLAFKNVLLKGEGDSLTIGSPMVSSCTVTSTITKIGKGKKVSVIHYKQKSRYFKKYGHRQPFFEVRIDEIK